MANVLLVDPDETAFMALKGFLTQYRHRCAVVTSEETAFEFVRENVFVDLMIVETKLEGSSGLNLLKRLRKDLFFRGVPVVFYAAKATPEEVRAILPIGVQNFLRKPYQENVLVAEVERAMEVPWYSAGLEPDNAYCRRTGHSLERRREGIQKLVSSIELYCEGTSEKFAELVKEVAVAVKQERLAKKDEEEEMMPLVAKKGDDDEEDGEAHKAAMAVAKAAAAAAAALEAEEEAAEAELMKLKEGLLLPVVAAREVAVLAGVPGVVECARLLEAHIQSTEWAEAERVVKCLEMHKNVLVHRLEVEVLEVSSQRAAVLLERLGKNAVMRSLPPSEVHTLIPFVRDFEIGAGQTLFSQGDVGDAMYLIDGGTLGVLVRKEGSKDPVRIAEITGGDIVGEMALITGAPRTATIRAETDVYGLRVEKGDFDRVLLVSRQMKRAVLALAACRSMENINRQAGEIDASAWAETANLSVKRLNERIPLGFMSEDEADAAREVTNIALWNAALEKESYPVAKAEAVLRQVASMPGCPVVSGTAAGFALAANGTAASLYPLMDLVEKDPGLAVQIFFTANELRQSKRKDTTTFIEDVRMGAGYLGEKRLNAQGRSLQHFRDHFMYVTDDANWNSYVRFLLATAEIARFACAQMDLEYLESSAYIGGLIHDFGRLLLLRLHPAGYVPIFDYAQDRKIPVAQAERICLGVTTREMAIAFVDSHVFPTRYKSVVRWVEEPEVAVDDADLVFVVAVARYLCRFFRVGFNSEIYESGLVPLQESAVWKSGEHRVFQGFNVRRFEAAVKEKCAKL